MKTLLQCSLLLFLIFSLCGCLQNRIIDEIAVVRTIGFDYENDKELKMSVSFPIFLEQGEQNIQERDVISTAAETVKGAQISLEQQSQKRIELGQLNVAMISQELAERGVEPFIDSLYRDVSVGNRVTLAMIDGQVEEILNADLGGGEQTGVYLSDLIQQNMDSNMVPATNMHEFLFSLYNDARDPFLPVIAIEDDRVSVTGTALFQRDTYIKTLDLEDSFYVKLMTTPMKQATKEFHLKFEEEESIAVVEKIFSNRRRTFDTSNSIPIYTINIKLEGEIIDYTGTLNLEEENLLHSLEKDMEKLISENGERLLVEFRDAGIDPVAVGEKYRSTTRDWDPTAWRDSIYPNVEFKVNADVEILSSGAIE